MTDQPSPAQFPPAPGGVMRFGVSFVGPEFTWTYAEKAEDSDELTIQERNFRSHPGLSFDEQIAYQRSLTMLQATAVIEQRSLEKQVDAITKLEGDDEIDAALEELANATAEGESKRWAMQVDQVCMLIAPADREAFRPLATKSNVADLLALKAWLVDVTVTRQPKQVEAAGRVDPTSQPSSAG